MVKQLGVGGGEVIRLVQAARARRPRDIQLAGVDQPADELDKEEAADLLMNMTQTLIGARAVGGKRARRRGRNSIDGPSR